MSAIFTEKELAKYGFIRALNQIVESQGTMPPGYPGELKGGLEREVDDALRNQFATNPGDRFGGIRMPLSALKTMNVTNARVRRLPDFAWLGNTA